MKRSRQCCMHVQGNCITLSVRPKRVYMTLSYGQHTRFAANTKNDCLNAVTPGLDEAVSGSATSSVLSPLAPPDAAEVVPVEEQTTSTEINESMWRMLCVVDESNDQLT